MTLLHVQFELAEVARPFLSYSSENKAACSLGMKLASSSVIKLLLRVLSCTDLFQEDGAMDTFFPGKLRLGLKFTPYQNFKDEPKHKMLGSLHIAIKQAQELPPMDTHGLTDATVKCYLLPNRSTSGKRKTKVVKNNLNPVWEEKFVYKNVTLGELSKERVLEVTVWDYDRRGSNDFIGGLHLGPGLRHAAKHSDLLDCMGEEMSHWEAMLTHRGEWIEKWHTLRATMDPMTSKHAASFVPPAKELSPVQELSPTQETSPPGQQLPTIESYSFTPPIVTTPPPTENPSHKVKQGSCVCVCVCACVCTCACQYTYCVQSAK